MRIGDRREVRLLLEVWTFNEQRAQAATDPLIRDRSRRRAHAPTRASTAQLDSPAVDDFARTGTSIVEPRISFETTRDRWCRIRAVVARRLWFVPFRHADGFGNKRSSTAGFSAREPATTDGSNHDGSLAQRAR